MPCACSDGHRGLCTVCWNGYSFDKGKTCSCCGRLGKRLPDPYSIAARLERGEPCHKCGVLTHDPWGIVGGEFVCNSCKPKRRG